MKKAIITWAVCVTLILAGIIQAGINRPIMIDDTTKENVTAVSYFTVMDTASFKKVSTWATAPTAGQFLRITADGKRLEGQAISSGVTGQNGYIDAADYKSLPYYSGATPTGVTLSPLSQMASAVLITSGASLPALSQTLPTAVQDNITQLGTLTKGYSGVTADFSSGVTADYFSGDGSRLTGLAGVLTPSMTGYIMYYTGSQQSGGLEALSGNSVVGGSVKSGVSTIEILTGAINTVRIAANSSQYLGGACVYGAWITGVSNADRAITAGMTFYLTSAVKGMNCYFFNEDQTTVSGNTIYLHFATVDIVKSDIPCTPGTSKYVLSGTTLQKSLLCISNGNTTWVVKTSGTPTVEAD